MRHKPCFKVQPIRPIQNLFVGPTKRKYPTRKTNPLQTSQRAHNRHFQTQKIHKTNVRGARSSPYSKSPKLFDGFQRAQHSSQHTENNGDVGEPEQTASERFQPNL